MHLSTLQAGDCLYFCNASRTEFPSQSGVLVTDGILLHQPGAPASVLGDEMKKKTRRFSWRFPGEGRLFEKLCVSCSAKLCLNWVVERRQCGDWSESRCHFFFVSFSPASSFIPLVFNATHHHRTTFFFFTPRHIAAHSTFKEKCVIFSFMSPIWLVVPVKGSRLAPFSTR